MPHQPSPRGCRRHRGRPAWPLRHYPDDASSPLLRTFGTVTLLMIAVALFVVVVAVTTW